MEEGSRDEVHRDGDDDKGEQAHGCHKGWVIIDKLEIDGDVVDEDVKCRGACCCHYV